MIRLGLRILAAALALVGLIPLGAPAGSAGAAEREIVGHSVLGRPIVATSRGEGQAADEVLVFGCIHGDEDAGVRVARRLLRAPAPRRSALWVVPSLNPDGVAAGTRGNARGVDLNRNFPLGWRPLGGLEYSGPRPLSEPESRAAARLIRRVEPDVTIWFHQPFGLVDRSGGAAAVERRFSRLVGLPYARIARPPGSVSSWQNSVFPRASAFVVELPARVDGMLVRRAARAVVTLANEYGGAEVGGAAVVKPAA